MASTERGSMQAANRRMILIHIMNFLCLHTQSRDGRVGLCGMHNAKQVRRGMLIKRYSLLSCPFNQLVEEKLKTE